MITNLKCVYCEVNQAGNTEHVFPKGLGGEGCYMNCVCKDCNNNFSKIKLQLFRNSPVGLMRSAEGVKGRWDNKTRPAPLKHPTPYFDEENKIVYEVEVYNGFNIHIRPQIIKVGDSICAAAISQEEFENLKTNFKNWKNENLIMVTKFHQKEGKKSYEAVEFSLIENKYVDKKIESSKKLTGKEVTHYSLTENDDKFKEYFQPRIYLDDSESEKDKLKLKLNVKSRNLEEGIQFVIDLLNSCNQEGATLETIQKNHANPEIFVSMKMKFGEAAAQRALVKIGLNALMHYYPETQYNSLLKPAKDFVLKGTRIGFVFDTRSSIADTRQDTHLVFFHQSENGLYIRMRLFGGHFNCQFLIEGLQLPLKQGEFSVLEVDFKKEKQKHCTQQEFILKIIEGSNECLPPVPGMN